MAGKSSHMSFMPEKKIGTIAISNDNRAYLWPHVMADYAYIVNGLPADSIFKSEKPKFNKGFESENEISYLKYSQ